MVITSKEQVAAPFVQRVLQDFPRSTSEDWVRLHKGTKHDIDLCLVSDAHECLPAGFEKACDG